MMPNSNKVAASAETLLSTSPLQERPGFLAVIWFDDSPRPAIPSVAGIGLAATDLVWNPLLTQSNGCQANWATRLLSRAWFVAWTPWSTLDWLGPPVLASQPALSAML
jgi:hypothetical protein